MKTRILVVDDEQMVRQALISLLSKEEDFEVVGEAPDGQLAVERAETLKPDVILMDIHMPVKNGLDAATELRSWEKPPAVIILTRSMDDYFVTQASEIGVHGYLLKTEPYEQVSRAIRFAMQGKTLFSQALEALLPRNHFYRLAQPSKKLGSKLTSREREVLQGIAEGGVNRDIARVLGVSRKTVEKHRQSIGKKLGVCSTAELTIAAFRLGLIEIPRTPL